jgi:hypothetical protein
MFRVGEKRDGEHSLRKIPQRLFTTSRPSFFVHLGFYLPETLQAVENIADIRD